MENCFTCALYSISFRVDFDRNDKLCSGPGCLRQLTWWKDDILLTLGNLLENGGNVICEISLSENDGKYRAKYQYVYAEYIVVLIIYILINTSHNFICFFFCIEIFYQLKIFFDCM